ncbi:FAD-dependent oxidoreductase [Streptomyces sp. Z26]|uniref:FAD-dependent oxidoreductase n=1 Tax=Streptomyces sp. Z26 TaxID=2500177 RepID=UPI000EF15F5D|nr:FAD-dependent oxidoreductase [Streptomyces sp. Z26]RLL67319.1 flavoprotein oxidoreductase [Streptomyces sp. Z26]
MVIIGGDAAGMSAASQARRLRSEDELEIVAFERGTFTSYSACGIPYWVGGEVDSRDELIARTPEEHRKRGIDLRLHTEVTEIDVDGRRVRTRTVDGAEGPSGPDGWTHFDKLVVATGARPVRPPFPGVDADGVHGVQSLTDGQSVLDDLAALERTDDGGRRTLRTVVVGAGYIGVEMSEALIRRGHRVTVLEQAEQPMSMLDPDMGALVREGMSGLGIEVVTGAAVREILTGADGRARAVVTDDGEYAADVVVLGIGVRPETSLARAAGLPVGESGGLLTDLGMRVLGQRDIWAGGDCVEVFDRVARRTRHLPLGTHANKHGQVIGTNAGGGYATFPGVVGTAVSKVCDLEIGRTGLLERQAAEAGLRYVTVTVESTSRAGYYPGAQAMHVKMLAEERTGRLLGTQIVGREGAGKRVDIAAVALTAGMTVEEMTGLDLGYAPPFSPVWDPVLVAARKAVSEVRARSGGGSA